MSYELLTRPQVEQRVRLSCSTLYRLMREGRFPLPLKISTQAVRWRGDEITDWLEAKQRATGEIGPANIPDIEGGNQYAAA